MLPIFTSTPPSNLCHLGMRHNMVTGVLRWVLGDHFANRDNIEAPGLRDSFWRADASGGIVIESTTRWDPSLVESRPAVMIKRNAQRPETLGIFGSRRVGGSPDGMIRYEFQIRGSHTLFCIAGEGEEVEILSAEVYTILLAYAGIIQQYMGLKRFTVAEIGPVGKLQEATENFAVPVTVAYAYTLGQEIYQHSPKLKRIEMSTEWLAP